MLDVEGADARARGRAGKVFQGRVVGFAAGVADCVVLNFWWHDISRIDGGAYGLLKDVLESLGRGVVEGSTGGGGWGEERVRRRGLVFVVRDADEAAVKAEVEEVLIADAEDMWEEISVSCGLQPGMMRLEEAVEIDVVLLPHIRHHKKEWAEGVGKLRGILEEVGEGVEVPAEDFSTYASGVWDSLTYTNTLAAELEGADPEEAEEVALSLLPEESELYAVDDLVIVAAFRCDEVFSALLVEASGEIGVLHDQVEKGSKVENLGNKCEQLIAAALENYEGQAGDFSSEPVFERKRQELEAILDQGLNAVFMRQLQTIREESIRSFRAAVEDDAGIPADYALFLADAAFVTAAKKCQRPASVAFWSYEKERGDLQELLSEISAAKRKLIATKLTAGKQQSDALQYLQIQNARMRSMQQQTLGGSVGQWSLGAAFRPPDTNVNVSLGYQQGKASLSISAVPDESASLLGPSGFTSGVGVGNVGLSFNLNA